MKRALVLSVLLFPLATSLFAWGEKGHYISNEAATIGLPNDMPLFFYRSFPELVYLGPDPDRIKGAGISIDAANTPDHFLDYEFVSSLNLPPDRYQYLHLGEISGTFARHGVTNSEPGFLPWRIAELTEQLSSLFRQWRQSTPGSPEREDIEHGVIHIAGTLGHFVADSANPLHDTMHHNGWLNPNPNHYATDCDVHSRFEGWFVSRAITTADVVPYLTKPFLRTAYFETAMAFIKQSNALVEPLYVLDRDGAFDPIAPPSAAGREFASARIAAGASLLRDLWWSAWKNSVPKPRQPRGTPAPAVPAPAPAD